jgi:hypothetical protein
MAKDDRDILDLLRFELDFVEQGGYGRSVKTPWKATSPFRDSLTCINYALPEKAHHCSNCHLIDFVPPERRSEELPCHHIPLNEAGDTVESLELEDNQAKLEQELKTWMRAKIRELRSRDPQRKPD